VDARGKGFQPCLVPRIKPSGTANPWADGYVSDPKAKNGVAGFVRRPEDAKVLKARGAPNQLTVRAVNVSGASRCDVEVSAADAGRIRKLETDAGLLRAFKVTFVF
jgi:hypothetical protein